MIYKGLDDDEAGFLQFVAVRQAERDAEDKRKELEELSDYRVIHNRILQALTLWQVPIGAY